MNKGLLIGFISALVTTACAPLMQYHGPSNGCNSPGYDGEDICSDEYIENGDGYSLGFIEIDDEGWFYDREQLKTINQKLKESEDIVLFVFAHGWKHDASDDDRDLRRVRNVLKSLSAQESRLGGDREIIGVYIGWRGESLSVPYLNNLSFYERKKTAHEVGDAVSEVFTDFQRIVDYKRYQLGQAVSYVVIGHSFGGAVVFSANKSRMIANQKAQNDPYYETGLWTMRPKAGSADMVILVNPAFEASRARELLDVYEDSEGAPYFVVMTADNDRATKSAFYWGRFFSNVFDHHTDDEQTEADLKAIGHYSPYFTHVIEDREGIEGKGCGKEFAEYVPLEDGDFLQDWKEVYGQPGHVLQLYDSDIRHLDGSIDPALDSPMAKPNSKIQIIRVEDRDILDKHSNIVCDDLVDLIQNYILFATRYQTL